MFSSYLRTSFSFCHSFIIYSVCVCMWWDGVRRGGAEGGLRACLWRSEDACRDAFSVSRESQ